MDSKNKCVLPTLKCTDNIEFPGCELISRTLKWEARNRHGVVFVTAHLVALKNNLMQ